MASELDRLRKEFETLKAKTAKEMQEAQGAIAYLNDRIVRLDDRLSSARNSN